MANISVTHIIRNGKITNVSEINQNFTDLLNGIIDGTKDINILNLISDTLDSPKLTVKGNMTVNNIDSSASDSDFKNRANLNGHVETNYAALSGSAEQHTLDATNSITPTKSVLEIGAEEFNDGDYSGTVALDATSNKFEITENGETVAETITLATGNFVPTQLATNVQNAMNAALTQTYTVTYSGGSDGTFTIASIGNPFKLWVTGGDVIESNAFLLKKMGFKLGGTSGSDTSSDSHTSDVNYQIGYYNVLDDIDLSNLFDGQIVEMRLMPSDDSGNYAPVVVSGDGVDILLSRYAGVFVVAKTEQVASPTPKFIHMTKSQNFFFTDY